MTKHIQKSDRIWVSPVAGSKADARATRQHDLSRQRRARRKRGGWSPERRARQAVLIRSWAPWQRSTGPKTEAGKLRCSQNALKHGFRSRATIREYQRIRHVLRLAARNIAILRAHIRARDQAARPQIKFKRWYARALGFAKPDCPSRPAGAIAPQ